MTMTINTNIASLNGQRNLLASQNKLNSSLNKLSSGLRINSAKDDAAGLAVSTRMSSQIRGLDQASRNANDGISLAQTAEGALQESTNILQRIRELAVQSVNDTNTDSDRTSMQAEVTQLTKELQRMSETTQFNGQNLLDGTLEDATFQVGANAGGNQSIDFTIKSAQTDALSQVGTTVYAGATSAGGDVSTEGIAAGSLKINGTAIDAVAAGSTNAEFAAAINDAATTANDGRTTTIATAQNVQTLDFTTVNLEAEVDKIGDTFAGTDAIATTANATGVGGSTTNGLTITSDAGGTAGNFSIAYTDSDGVTDVTASWAGSTLTLTGDWDGTGTNEIDSTLNDLSSEITSANSDLTISIVGGTDTKVTGTTATAVEFAGTEGDAAKATINISSADAALVDGTTLQFGIGTDSETIDLTGVNFDNATDGATLATELTKSADIDSASWATTGGGQLTITSSDATPSAAEKFSVIDTITDDSGLTKSGTPQGTYTLTLDSGTAIDVAETAGAKVTAQELADAISSETGFTAKVNDDDKVEITKDDGSEFTLKEDIDLDGPTSGTTGTDAPVGTLSGLEAIGSTITTYTGQVSLSSTSAIEIEEVTEGALAKAGLNTAGNATTTIDKIDISTSDGASTAITSVDAALQQINESRGSLGALQSRFESTINNLGSTSENISAARSRIVDADFASETAEMTKAQILQQAGTAMLAQANQLPQAVLSLLQ